MDNIGTQTVLKIDSVWQTNMNRQINSSFPFVTGKKPYIKGISVQLQVIFDDITAEEEIK